MWNLLQIELFKISKRPRTYIAFAAIAAIVFIFQFAFKADGQSYMNLMLQSVKDSFEFERTKAINGYFMCYIILNTLLVQLPILVALIAADSISGEANMGTLRLLITKPISRTQLILVKFAAATIFTILLLVWMAIISLFFSLLIFGADDMLIFRSKGDESQILLISQDDVMWRYLAAFAYATVALTVIAALSLFFLPTHPFTYFLDSKLKKMTSLKPVKPHRSLNDQLSHVHNLRSMNPIKGTLHYAEQHDADVCPVCHV